MEETNLAQPQLVNLVTLLSRVFKNTPLAGYLILWQDIIFSLLIAGIILLIAYFACKKQKLIPGRLQAAAEIFAGGIDDLVCGIMGPRGRKFTPFIGTLFIYILFMNLSGLVPFFKSSTSSWSVTLALALCVFIYVQYTGFKELGFWGYLDVLAGRPRGFLRLCVIFPVLMFCLHLFSELIRPISLSLRLRSNIWGDDLLLTVLAGFGMKGLPVLLFSSLINAIGAIVQALVFSLLTVVYFTFIIIDTEEKQELERRM